MKKIIYSLFLIFLSSALSAQLIRGDGDGDEFQFPGQIDLGSNQTGAGSALDFDGVNDYVLVPNIISEGGLNFSTGFSIEFWFHPDSLHGIQTWVSKISATNDSGVVVQTNGSVMQCSLRMDTSWVSVSFSVNQNEWQHVAFSASDGTGLTGYLNGITQAFAPNSGSFIESDEQLRLGSGNGANFADGKLDELRIWDASLDSSTIREYISKRLDYSHTNIFSIASYFQFDETSGSILLPDLTGNADGVLINMDSSSVWTYSGALFAAEVSYVFGDSTLSHTLQNGSVVTISNFSSFPQAIFIYGSYDAPRGSVFPSELDSSNIYEYFGVNVLSGGTFDIEVDYSMDEGYSSGSKSQSIRVYSRDNGEDVSFEKQSSFFSINTTSKTINISNQGKGEFVFGYTTNAYPEESGSGYALNFDGTNDEVTIPYSTGLQLSDGAFTIAFWAKPELVNSNFHWVIDKSASNSDLDYLLGLDFTNKWRFTARNLSIDIAAGPVVAVGEWYHVAGVFDGATASLFVNGVLVGSDASVGSAQVNTENVVIGTRSAGPGQEFDGDIDEISIWDVGLTEEELRDLMGKKVTVSHSKLSNLVAYYRFDENGGTALSDLKGGNNGAMMNMDSSTDWVPSGAEIGDDVSYTFGGTSVTDTLDNGTVISIRNFTGNPDGLFLYNVLDTAKNSTFLNISNFSVIDSLSYIGVNMIGGSSYDVVYDFSNNPAFSSSDFVKTVVAFKRSNGSDGTWEQVTGVLHIDVANKTLTISGQTGTEYVLGFSNTTYPSEPGSGFALNFDGTADYLTVPASTSLNFTEEFTIEGWINANSSASLGAIYSQFEGGTSNRRVELQFKSSAKIGLVLSDDGATNSYFLESNATIPLNEWVHVAVTFKGGVGVVLYVNGASESFTATGTIPTTIHSAAEITTIGASRQGAQNFFNGALDEMRIWSTALSENDIRKWMTKKLNSSHDSLPKLVSYYRLDENSGTTVQDLASGNHGTINGSPTWSTSGAALGDSSSYTYGGTDLTLSYPNGDNLTVNNLTGSPDGVHIYYVNDTANTTTIPPGIDSMEVDGYGGTFVVGGTNPTYSTKYTYSTVTLSASAEREINLATRPSNDSPGWAQANLSNRSHTSGTNNVIVANNSENSEFVLATGANNSLLFDGTNDYVDLGAVSSFPMGSSARTIEAWIKKGTSSGTGSILSYGSSTASNRFGFRINNGRIGLDISSSQVFYNTNLSDDQWHHVAISYEAGQPISAAKFYVDGVEQTSISSSTGISTIPNTVSNDGAIGSRLEGSLFHFDGNIDELRVWGRALCVEELDAIRDCEEPLNQFGLLAYYDFNQGSASGTNTSDNTLIDRSGNGISGALTNMSLTGTTSNWVSGSVGVSGSCSNPIAVCGGYPEVPGSGYALDFDGVNDYVSIPDNDGLDLLGNWTIETWVNFNDVSTKAIIEKYAFLAGGGGYALRTNAAGRLQIWNIEVNTFDVLTGTTVLNTNQWYHIAATMNRSTNTLRLFINGVEDGVKTDATKSITAGATALKIGARGDDNGIPLNGTVDEVRVWSTELSQDNIRDWMTKKINFSHPEYENMEVYYRFDDNSGSTLTDLYQKNGVANNGTLINSPSWVTSGASIGDESSYTYGGTSLSSSINNNQITIDGFAGSPSGAHIYLINDTAEYSTYPTNLNSIDSIDYFGVFLVGGSAYNLTVDYSGNSEINGQTNESRARILEREGASDNSWEVAAGEMHTDELANIMTVPDVQGREFSTAFFATSYPQQGGAGYTLNFDGNNDYIEASANAWYPDDNVDDYTYESWVKLTEVNTLQGVVSYAWDVNTAEPHSGLWVQNGQLRGYSRNDNNTSVIVDISGGAIVANEWTHVAFTKTGSTYAIYVNGVQVNSANATISGTFNRNKFLLGSTWNSTTYQGPLKGQMDEARVWKTGLSQSDIRDWMTKKINNTHPQFLELAHYYRLDEGSGTTVQDLVGINDAFTHANFGPTPTWTISGAPLGDKSVNTYGGTTLAFTLDNDNELTVDGFVGTVDGLHIYESLDSASGSSYPQNIREVDTSGYFGVFKVGGDNYNLKVEYGNNTSIKGAAIEPLVTILKRDNETDPSWDRAAGELNIQAEVSALNSYGLDNSQFVIAFNDANYPVESGSGYALDLIGDTNYVDIGFLFDPSVDNFTLESWVYIDSLDGNQVIFQQLDANGRSLLYITDGGNIKTSLGSSGTGSANIIPKTWNHIAMTWSGSVIRFYLNGVFDGGFSRTATSATGSIRLGKASNNDSANLNGKLDEVRVWNTALSENDIREWMTKKVNATHSNISDLLAYYRFDENSGTTLQDLAGGNNSTITNMDPSTDWVASGAALGDSSVFTYGGTSLSTTLSNQNVITLNGFEGTPNGIHLYTVTDTAQGSTYPTTITNADSTEYFGVYMVGGDSYDVTVDFSGNSTLSNATNADNLRALTRDNNADPTWEQETGRIFTSIKDYYVSINNQTGTEYALGFTNTTYPDEPGSGYTLDFDGVDDYVEIGSVANLNGAFTVDFWFNSSNDAPAMIMGWGEGSGVSEITGIGVGDGFTGGLTNELITIYKISGGGFTTIGVESTDRAQLFDGKWHNVAITYDGSTSYTFYIDGILKPTTVANSSAGFNLNIPTADHGTIAGRKINGSYSNFLTGSIDEFRIWNNSLDSSQIRTWMTKKLNATHDSIANLLAYYRFDENSGTTLIDLASGNDGTITNGATWATSGAALGDTSVYAYPAAAINLDGVNKKAALSNYTGGADGVHLYYVYDTANNTTIPSGLDSMSTSNGYFGTFMAGGTNPTHDINLTYLTEPTDKILEYEGNLAMRESNADSWIQGALHNRTIDTATNKIDVSGLVQRTEFTLASGANNALAFDGVNDYVQVNNNSSLNFAGAFTAECWFYRDANTFGSLISQWTAGTSRRWELDVTSTGQLKIHISDDGTNNFNITSLETVALNEWHHATVGFWPGDSCNLYLDGSKLTSQTTNGAIPSTINNSLIDLNLSRSAGDGNYFNGEIDEVKIWNRALCADELSFNRNCESPGNTDSLLLYYNFNQGSASSLNTGLDSLVDQSGNGNTGALTNMALSGSSSNWVAGSDSVAGGCGSFTAPTITAITSIINQVSAAVNGNAIVTASGGNSYTYLWSNGQTTDSLLNVGPGVYYVTVTENCGATVMDTVEFLAPGGALDFDGVDDYVKGVNINEINNAEKVTIEYWINPKSVGGFRHHVNKGSIIRSQFASGNGLNVHMTGFGTVSTAAAIPINTWTHIAVVFDGTQSTVADRMRIYYNGISQALTNTSIIPSQLGSNTNPLTLGAHSPNGSLHLNGSLDEVRIWRTARTQSEIQTNLNCKIDSLDCNLLVYYDFNQGFSEGNNSSITILQDRSSNNYNGTLTNFARTGTSSNFIQETDSIIGNCTLYTLAPITATNVVADSNASTAGGADGGATVSVTGGSSLFSYIWSNTATTASITGLTAGKYYVTVTDDCGPAAIDSVTILETAGALSLDGLDDYIEFPAGMLSTANDFTYEAWVNLNTNSNWQRLFDFGSGTSDNLFFTTRNSADGTPRVAIRVGSGPEQLINTSTVISTGGWHHFAFTIDDLGNGTVEGRMYIDGVMEGSNLNMTLNPSDLGITTQNWIGKSQYSHDPNLDALIDEVRLWSRALCADELSFNRNCESPGNTDSLLAYYDFNQGLSQGSNSGLDSLVDLSGNGKTGMLNNFALIGTTSNWVAGSDSISGNCGTYTAQTLATTLNFNTVSCNGLGDGWVKAVVTSSDKYTYLWSNAETTDSIGGLATGTYIVTVTGSCGSTAVDSVTITEPNALIVSASVDSTIACYGAMNGGATVNATGGTSPYSYLWSNSATTAFISGVAAGNYFVTVSDANNCLAVDSVLITEPDSFSASLSTVAKISCNGGNGAQVGTTVSGGTGPFAYSGSNGSSGSTSNNSLVMTNISAGAFSVTVTDTNGCVANANTTITEPTAISLSTSSVNVSCSGASDGTVAVSASGGTAPYQYNWSTGDTLASISNVAAGSYTVVVYDSNSCVDTATVTITEPTSLNASITVDANVSCNGATDGGATASISGGTAPYQYNWSSGDTLASISNVAAGNYTAVVYDANGCVDTATVTITEPSQLMISAIVDLNASCSNSNDGQASVSGSGGTAPYQYNWSTGDTTNSSSNLMAGTYSVVVNDVNGCVDTATVNINFSDTIAPILSASNGIAYLGNRGSVQIDTSFFGISVSDNCAIDSVIVSPSSFTCLDTGMQTVTIEAVDVNGNRSSTNVMLAIQDSVAPIFNVSPISIDLDTSGNASIAFTDLLFGGTEYFINFSDMTGFAGAGACGGSLKAVTSGIESWTWTDKLNSSAGVDSVILELTMQYSANSNVHTFSLNGDSLGQDFGVGAGACNRIVKKFKLDINSYNYGGLNIFSWDLPAGFHQLNNNPSWGGAYARVTVFGAGVLSDNCTDSASIATNLSKSSFNCTDIGTQTITVSATDAYSNVTTTSTTVTVADKIIPTAVAQNITVYLDSSGGASITANNIGSGSTDNCSSLTLAIDTTSFDCADLGTNNVTLTVTDVGGNTSSATAIVTVLDTTAPSAIVQNISVHLDSSGNASIIASDIDNGSSDNCSSVTLSIDTATFDCSDVGTNNVILTVTDGSGNTATATSVVTVVDSTAPIMIAQNVRVYSDSLGVASLSINDLSILATDNCGISSLSISDSLFDCNALLDTLLESSSAMSFDGVNDYLITNVFTYNQTQTWETWVKTNPGYIIQSFDGLFTLGGAPRPQVNFGGGGTINGTDGFSFSGTTGINDQQWHHVAVVIDSTTMYLYIDGVLDATGTNSVSGSHAKQMKLATERTGGARWSDITLDEVRIWDVAKSQSEIQASMNTPALSGNETDLLIYYTFEEGAPSGNNSGLTSPEVIDQTPNGINGTLVNMAKNGTTSNWVEGKSGISLGKTIAVSAQDKNGNATTDSISVSVIDTISPTAVAQNIIVYLDANGSASIVPTDVDNGSNDNCGTVTLAIDSSSFDCLELGANNVVLTVTDGSSNVSSATAVVTVVDTTAPTAVAQNITVYLDTAGNVSIASADVDGGSTDNCGVDSLLIDLSSFDCSDVGTNNVTLTVIDDNANSSTAVAVVTVVDTTAPTAVAQNITVYLDTAGNVSIAATDVDGGSTDNCGVDSLLIDLAAFDCSDVGMNNVTLTVIDDNANSSTAVAVVTVVDTTAPTAVAQNITVYLDTAGNVSIAAADVDGGSTDNCGVDSLLIDLSSFDCSDVGTNNVTLTVIDDNSNSSTAVAVVTVVDSTAPTAVTQNITVYLDTAGNVSITASDVDGGSADNCGVDSLLIDLAAFDCSDVGTNNVTLTVIDDNANSSTAVAVVTVVDTTAPTAVAQNITVYLDTAGNVSIVASDVDGGSADNCGVDSLLIDLAAFDCSDVGTNNVTLTVIDDNSNSSTAVAVVTVVDSTAPTAVTQNITVYLDTAGNVSIVASDVDGGSSDNCGVDSLLIDLAAFDCSDVGTNNVTLTVIDDNANSSTAVAVVTVVDTTAPTAVAQNITVYLDTAGNVSIVASDVDGGSTDNCGVDSLLIDLSSFDCSDVGTNNVTLTVIDDNANSSTAVAVVTVVDSTAPTAVAQNITVYLDTAGNVSIVASDVDGGSADNCGVDSLLIDLAAFDCSDVGTNNVTLTVIDDNSNSSTAVAVVTVVDSTAPTAVAQNITVYLDTAGNVSITASDVDGGSADNCGVDSLLIDLAAFDCSDVGTNNVTLTVIDDNANSSTAVAVVTVVDTTAPLAVAQNITVYLDTAGNVSIAASDVDGGSTDNCGVDSLLIDLSSFDCSDVGTNNVTLTVIDDNANSSTAVAVVTVVDTTAPTAVAQNITVYLDTAGNVSIAASDVDGGSTDNCGVDSLLIDLAAFDCSDVGTNNVTLTVIDDNSNSSTAVAVVTVVDSTAPTAVTQNITVYLDTAGNVSIAASDIDNGTADNCSIASLALSNTAFDCSNVGANTVQLIATDVNGNVDSASAVVTVLDTLNPIVVTQGATVYLDAAGAASVTTTDIDNGTSDNCGTPILVLSNTAFDCSNVGANTVQLIATDVNGNVDSASAVVTVVDTLTPIVVTQAVTVYLDAAGAASITTTDINNGTADNCGTPSLALSNTAFDCSDVGANTVQLIATDVNGNVDSASAVVTVLDTLNPIVVTQAVTVYLDAAGTASITTTDIDNSTTDNCGTPSLALSNTAFDCSNVGANTVQLIATDVNGNVDSASAVVTVLDTLTPIVVTQGVTVYLDAAGAASITTTDIDNGTADNCSIASLALSNTSFDCSNVGANTVQLIATDVNGNVDSASAVVTVLDTLNPIVVTQGVTVYLDAAGAASITTTDIDNGTADNCGTPSLALSNTAFDCSNVGANTVQLIATDVNGNVDSASAVVTVLDTLTPIVVTQAVTVYLDAAGAASITTTDIDNGTSDNCSIASLALSNTAFDCSNVGANTVQLIATDVNGNVDSASAVVTVLDTLNPIVVTQGVTVYLDAAGAASITTTDIDNGTADNCGTPSLALSNTAFDCSNVGANTVQLIATDVNGNVDSASAVVTVLDTLTPIVVTQAVTVYLDAAGAASITTTDIDNGTSDNCGTPSLALSNTAFDCSDVGANTVQLIATDVNGNVDSASAVVTVLDTIKPGVITQAVTVYLDASGAASITTSDIDNGTADNCSIASLALSNTAFDCSNVGANTVQLIATDVNGNVDSASATITVTDTIKPTITCLADTVICDQVFTFTVPTGNDNCAVQSVVQTAGIPSGGTYPVGVTTNTFVVTDVNGNVDSCSFTVTRDDFPTISNAGVDINICVDTFSLSANTASVGVGSWSTITAGVTFDDSANPTTTIRGLTRGDNILIWSISNGVCDPSTDTITVTYDDEPTTALAGNDQIVCEVDNAVLAGNSATSGQGVWTTSSSAIVFADSTNPNTSISDIELGVTELFWTISNGTCSNSEDTLIITRVLNPIVNAGDDQTIFKDDGATLEVNSSADGQTGVSYSWEPAFYLTSNTQRIAETNSFLEKTTEFTVEVTSPEGCIGNDTLVINVNEMVTFSAAFTPNGDGKNDLWLIKNIQDPSILNHKVTIFDGYGSQIFSSNNFQGWDGTFNGSLLPVASYYYTVEINFLNGESRVETGLVTILR